VSHTHCALCTLFCLLIFPRPTACRQVLYKELINGGTQDGLVEVGGWVGFGGGVVPWVLQHAASNVLVPATHASTNAGDSMNNRNHHQQLQSEVCLQPVSVCVRLLTVLDVCARRALQHLVEFIRQRQGQCGIIYARLRATCDWLGTALGSCDLDVGVYHAGKDAARRRKVRPCTTDGVLLLVGAGVTERVWMTKAGTPACALPCMLASIYRRSMSLLLQAAA
jgi:hypothetical protein